MAQLFSNNAIARLVTNVSPISTSIWIDPARANLFPNPTHVDDWFLITLDDINNPDNFEIVKISHRTGNQLHVAERGFEGTVADTWTVDDTICDHRVTAGTLSSFLPVKKINYFQILPNTSRIVDQFEETSNNKVVKWHITLDCNDAQKTQAFELSALIKDQSTAPKWTKFAVLGDKMNFTLNVDRAGSNIRLVINNSELDDMSVNAVRIQLT